MAKSISFNGSKDRVLNCIPSTLMEKDWLYDDALAADFAKPQRLLKDVDLRESWWYISDQGRTGSCVGQAVADGLLRWHFVNKGTIGQNELLSVRFIWMASKETDEFNTKPSSFLENAGTSLKGALDIARDFGCVKDSVLPFLENCKLYPGDEREFYAIASNFKIKNYFNLSSGAPKTKSDIWREWLSNGNGPIVTRLNVDSEWDNIKSNGNLDTYYPNSTRGGHAVTIVGFKEGRFIIRNSWGDKWGDKGFANASIAYSEAAFTESYGVTV